MASLVAVLEANGLPGVRPLEALPVKLAELGRLVEAAAVGNRLLLIKNNFNSLLELVEGGLNLRHKVSKLNNPQNLLNALKNRYR